MPYRESNRLMRYLGIPIQAEDVGVKEFGFSPWPEEFVHENGQFRWTSQEAFNQFHEELKNGRPARDLNGHKQHQNRFQSEHHSFDTGNDRYAAYPQGFVMNDNDDDGDDHTISTVFGQDNDDGDGDGSIEVVEGDYDEDDNML